MMMNSPLLSAGTLPAPADFSVAISVLALAADPVGAKARLDELIQATSQAHDLLDQAKAAQAALKTAADEQAKTLAAERDAHSAAIASEASGFQQMCTAMQSALANREAAVAANEKQLAADRAKLDADRADLDRRIAAVARAAAA
jgi:hypothetical protein